MHLANRAARHGGWLAALVLCGLLAQPAIAVVIAGAYESPQLVVPGDDPGWNNVGRVAGASGVYLGNRWVITANHVSGGALILDGRSYLPVPGTDIRLDNPGAFASLGDPDLRMFRIAEDPQLAS
jgi:hypothetical protein